MSAHEFDRVPEELPDTVVIADAQGMVWRVTEHDARLIPGRRGDRCLVFSSVLAVRRVWDFPAGWRDLPAAQLIEVSWRL